MTTEVVTASLLIAVPVAFNLAFFELGRVFDYPNILRKEPDEILRRFAAGGSGLILRWEALLLSALAMLPLVAMLAIALGASAPLTVASIVVGSAAALVQGLGLVRWPFAVPELARRYIAAEGPDAATTRGSIVVTFATLHRLLGVGIGEHLGYLLTGIWTLLIAASVISTAELPGWLGILGIPIGIALLMGTLEFAGPNEEQGWALAGTVVPIAYISWSVVAHRSGGRFAARLVMIPTGGPQLDKRPPRQPRPAPAVRPWMKLRCRTRKRSSGGRIAIARPAKVSPWSVA
jgi:hypothetical protein